MEQETLHNSGTKMTSTVSKPWKMVFSPTSGQMRPYTWKSDLQQYFVVRRLRVNMLFVCVCFHTHNIVLHRQK